MFPFLYCFYFSPETTQKSSSKVRFLFDLFCYRQRGSQAGDVSWNKQYLRISQEKCIFFILIELYNYTSFIVSADNKSYHKHEN